VKDQRHAEFREADFTGARFHSVIFSKVKISDALLFDVDISGLLGTMTINGVEVGAYVRAELDERHPERRLLAPTDPNGVRAAWQAIEDWSQRTLDRARARPPEQLDASVDGEWSYLQTLRHLVFATDRWITGPLLRDPEPFHRLGLPNEPHDDETASYFDLAATPSLDEVLAVRRERMDRVGAFITAVGPDDLPRTVPSPNGGTISVISCLHVVFNEEWWHDQYANRDLAILEAR
jgi:hypothetical protein